MTQYQMSTSGPLVMKYIGILLHHFIHFSGKNGVYENTQTPFDAMRSNQL